MTKTQKHMVKWIVSVLTFVGMVLTVAFLATVATLGIESNDLRSVMSLVLSMLGGGFIAAPVTMIVYDRLDEWADPWG